MGPGRAYIHTKRLSFKHHSLVDLEAFKSHHISVQKLKGCTKERSDHSCFFFPVLSYAFIAVASGKRILERISAEE